MDSPSAPPAPDYTGAAEATAAGNLANINAQTWANRPNQTTPWGSSSWTTSETFDQAGYDRAMADWRASGGNAADRPEQNAYYRTQWNQNLTLTPAQQAALNDQQQIQANQSDLAMLLQGQAADTMANGFTAPNMNSYLSGVPGVQTSFGNFNPSGAGSVNRTQYNPSAFTSGVQGVNQSFGGGPALDTSFTSGVPGLYTNFRSSAPSVNTNAARATAGAGNVNLSAPSFTTDNSAEGARAAYGAATELLKDQWEQDSTALDNKLRLQGLTPGSEAYNNAMQNLSRTQAQQQNQLANQAVLTGNEMANTNYASALAGYTAGNQAQNQAFSQGLDRMNAQNAAIGQQFGQDATAFGLTNEARNQSYANALNAYNSQNTAANQQFQNNLSSYGATNDARTQALQNGLAQYQAALQGQSSYNNAQQQAYNQALAGYGANQSAQQMSNAAQQQAYEQAMGRYNSAYQSAYNNYMMPLNSMNAVLNGQQVQNPNMPSFATAGTTGGADYMGAMQGQSAWNQGIYNAQVGSANANNAALAGVAGAALMMF